MTKAIDTDLCVLGAGPAAVQVAAAAAALGARTVLVAPGESAPWRPAGLRALVEAGRAAAAARDAAGFGIRVGEPAADWAGVRRHIDRTLEAARAAEAPARLAALGVESLAGPGRFIGADRIEAAGRRVRARRFVVVPPVAAPSGWDVLAALPALPRRLAVHGGGPEAVALAQALGRLGVQVALDATGGLLPGFDPELASVVERRLAAEGIDRDAAMDWPVLAMPDLRPGLDDLGLAEAGIAWSLTEGIVTGNGVRTTNRRVWALPSAAALHPTAAAAQVLKSALLRLPGRRPPPLALAVTDPELAQVGLDEGAARRRGDKFRLLRWPFADVEQAQAERRPDGLVKVVVDRWGRVLGAGIAGPRAAELIAPWVVAVARRLPAAALAEAAPPSPSLADCNRLAAASVFAPLLLSGRLQAWVRLMLRLGR